MAISFLSFGCIDKSIKETKLHTKKVETPVQENARLASPAINNNHSDKQTRRAATCIEMLLRNEAIILNRARTKTMF